jgi:menaquinol-cytochrome c reductase iron-sulfur subunit
MNSARSAPPQAEGPQRRSFLWAFAAVVVGAISGLTGLAAGIWVYLDPLMRRPTPPVRAGGGTTGPGEGFIRIASLDSIPSDGIPRRFPVIADQLDAWNFTPNQPIGAVFVRREAGDDLQIFHSTCPHAGCSVSVAETAFHCPCHNSSFDFRGAREARPGKLNPSPRDLDQLAYEIVDGEVWVEFQDFYTGRPEKTPKI